MDERRFLATLARVAIDEIGKEAKITMRICSAVAVVIQSPGPALAGAFGDVESRQSLQDPHTRHPHENSAQIGRFACHLVPATSEKFIQSVYLSIHIRQRKIDRIS